MGKIVFSNKMRSRMKFSCTRPDVSVIVCVGV